MSDRIDDLEKTVCKLVEESNNNDTLNNANSKNNSISDSKN
jgi:hypothetical protein